MDSLPYSGRESNTHMKKPETATLKPDQAHALLGGTEVISRASFYAGIRRNEIPHLRIGKRILIPRHAFMNWMLGQQQGRQSA